MIRLLSAAAALIFLAGCAAKPEPLPPPTPEQTRMEIALLRSNADLARAMLDSGVNPNGATRNGVPYLISAAAKQDLVLTEILLEHGADVNFCADAKLDGYPVLFDGVNIAVWNACRYAWDGQDTTPMRLVWKHTRAEADDAFAFLRRMLALGADVQATDRY